MVTLTLTLTLTLYLTHYLTHYIYIYILQEDVAKYDDLFQQERKFIS